MNNFSAYFKIAKRHLGVSLMYLGIFFGIVILLIMNAGNHSAEAFKSTKVDIAVYDKDNSALSMALYQYLDETQTIVKLEEEDSAWKDSMYTHKVEYILIIPDGFEEKMEAGEASESLVSYQSPGTKYSMFVEMKINSFLKTYRTYAKLGNTPEKAYELTLGTIGKGAEVTLEGKKNREVPAYSYYFRYIPYVLPCILLLGVAPCISAFNREEIRSRTFCSRISYTKRNMQITLASVLHSLMFSVFLILAGIVMYASQMTGMQVLIYTCNTIVHTAACLGLAYGMSQFMINENINNMVANVFSLASAFLCGVFVERVYLPDSVLAVGHAFPAYWYINLHEIAQNWSGSREQMGMLGTSLLMQVGFAMAFICFGLAVGKKRKK